METFVYQELAAQADFNSLYSLYQYRDREKREIDFLVERDGGALIGIEVKASHSVSSGRCTMVMTNTAVFYLRCPIRQSRQESIFSAARIQRKQQRMRRAALEGLLRSYALSFLACCSL